ncbi:MAG TPA: biotin--[acetyl-CoA-carboxylase] ligase [Candidatus Alistipes merdigallinarum]|nr:biotin--[acetyl-CoA-carboxylase] ligase [Candidatus Alistipes merdigallinarum]
MDLKQRLKHFAAAAGFGFYYFDELTSTNDEARDPRYEAGDVILAERQSRGRGQKGNRWSSESGVNLTFSVILCPGFLPAERQFRLLQSVALAVADTLDAFDVPARIKWPNDIYAGDRKAVGMLIENDLSNGCIARSIAGIGINVNQTEFDPSLPNPTSLARERGQSFDRGAVFETFYRKMSSRFAMLECGEEQQLAQDYLERMYGLDERRIYIDGRSGKRFEGVIRHVLPSGELEVEHADGSLHRYLFKEIEYVIESV